MKGIISMSLLLVLALSTMTSGWTVPEYAYNYRDAVERLHADPLDGVKKYSDGERSERGTHSCYDGKEMRNIPFWQVERFDKCVARWNNHPLNTGRELEEASTYMHRFLGIDTEREFVRRHPTMFRGEGLGRTTSPGLQPIKAQQY